jgi:putative transposase
MKRVAIEALANLQARLGICLIGYVVMPEHLHVLAYPHRKGEATPIPIGAVLQCFKQYLGRHGRQRLRDVWRQQGSLWSEPLNQWARGALGEQAIMHTRGHDRNIFTERELREKLDYCHKNPITRGLTPNASEWKWSSFRFYEFADCSILAMDWDGAWPILW